MNLPKHNNLIIVAAVCVIGLGIAAAVVPTLRAAQSNAVADAAEEKRWVAVAPGRVEPLSGQIKITAPAPAMIGEVLAKANDKVFAGEALVRLTDDEVSARFATAEAQVALRRRVRDDRNRPRSRQARGARPRMRLPKRREPSGTLRLQSIASPPSDARAGDPMPISKRHGPPCHRRRIASSSKRPTFDKSSPIPRHRCRTMRKVNSTSPAANCRAQLLPCRS